MWLLAKAIVKPFQLRLSTRKFLVEIPYRKSLYYRAYSILNVTVWSGQYIASQYQLIGHLWSAIFSSQRGQKWLVSKLFSKFAAIRISASAELIWLKTFLNWLFQWKSSNRVREFWTNFIIHSHFHWQSADFALKTLW